MPSPCSALRSPAYPFCGEIPQRPFKVRDRPGLMAGIFGTKSWMARRAGQATSAAKAAAARENGAEGGRPRKSANR